MEQGALGMVGTTFRRAGQAGLAYYTLGPDPARGPESVDAGAEGQVDGQGCALARLHRACGFTESVYVATCNRVELYFLAEQKDAVAHYRQRFFDYFRSLRGAHAPAPFADARGLVAFADEGAAERLFVVASALDSMVPGEAQILGQVKAALARAQASRLCGRQLATVFEEAFVVAKKVRQDTSLSRGRTSMVSLAAELLGERLLQAGPAGASAGATQAHEVDSASRAVLVVVGTGEMAAATGRAFAEEPRVQLLFVNRTAERASVLAEQFGGSFLPLSDFLRAPPPFAAMLTSTASPVPLFGAAFLRQLTGAPRVVDLSVNRDVELLAAQQAGLDLFDIDSLEVRARAHKAARRSQIAEGRVLVDEALERFRSKQTERSLARALSRWRCGNRDALNEALAALREKMPNDQPLPIVEAWARQLLNTWMHGPTHGLKRVAHLYGQEAVSAFVDGARLADPQTAPATPVPPHIPAAAAAPAHKEPV